MNSLTFKDFLIMEMKTQGGTPIESWQQGVAHLGGFAGQRPYEGIDVQDIVELFDIVREAFHDTEEMYGVQKKAKYHTSTGEYEDIPYNVVEDVRGAVEAYYIGGNMPKGTLKRWQLLDRYILQPFLAQFEGLPHLKALDVADDVIDSAIEYTYGPSEGKIKVPPRTDIHPSIEPGAPDPDDIDKPPPPKRTSAMADIEADDETSSPMPPPSRQSGLGWRAALGR